MSRRMPRRRLAGGGFTLVELLVTLALVAIAASVVLPLASIAQQRGKEAELRQALRTIRQALDDYKAAADAGRIDKPTGTSGYPPDLDVLAAGVAPSAAAGANAMPFVFLRRVPRDPFHPDKSIPASQTWRTRSYAAPAGQFDAGADIFDVASKSDQVALDGTRVRDW